MRATNGAHEPHRADSQTPAAGSYLFARSGGMALLKHEPSAQIPWPKTMLLFGAIIRSSQSPGLVLGAGTASQINSERQKGDTGTTRSRGFF